MNKELEGLDRADVQTGCGLAIAEELLTITELANSLKVPKSWVYSKTRLRGKNTIPVLRCGKHLRFRFSAVLDWLQRQQ